MQSDVTVSEDNKISGLLYYVDDFTGFSSLPDEQKGNYLATTYTPEPAEADVWVYKTNGTVGWKKLTKPDLTLISRITDPSTQKLQVYYELDGIKSDTIEYDLSGLILDEPEEDEGLEP